jgi:hypothetical protein
MLGKSSVLMMLLLGTGSLVAISSMYMPANVETQPQPQPQKPQTPLQGGIIMPRGGLGSAQDVADQKRIMQTIQDKQLLDRLMPEIIKRLDVKLILTQRPGQTMDRQVSGLLASGGAAWGKASCQPGETAVSAGFTHQLSGGTEQSIFTLMRNDPNSNAWDITTSLDGSGKIRTYAECLKVVLSLKDAQQPQAQQPSPPPGGPPLRPPPEFGK